MVLVFVVTTTGRDVSAGCWIASTSRTRIVVLLTRRSSGFAGSCGSGQRERRAGLRV